MYVFVGNGRGALVWVAAALVALAMAGIVWGLRRVSRKNLALLVSGILVVLLVGISLSIEWNCVAAMNVPLRNVDGQMRDNDGAVRMWMLVAAVWIPFLALGLLSLIAWVARANGARSNVKAEG